MPQLKLFGGALVQDEQGATSSLNARRHPLALLALLALAPAGRISRGKLVGLLWPEAPERVARNRLTSCLYDVRSALGDQVITSTGGDLSFSSEALACDALQFEAALQAGAHDRAVELYSGPFLDGFWLRDTTEFEQWMERERDRLRRRFHEALEVLAGEAASRGELDAAVGWWRRRVDEEPYDSRIVRRLLETLAAAGSRGEALRVARAHARLLEAEFGTEPDAGIQALVRTLQNPPSSGHGTSTVTPAVPHASGSEAYPARTVAVLPFRNVSGHDDAEPFTVGLHDDLLTELARIPGLTIISRASVQRYRGSSLPLAHIARELGVGTIVEGGVQSSGGRLRLNVQLIDAVTGAHRWVERYDRELTTGSIFDIQSDLASRIATSLQGELDTVARRSGAHERTNSLEAYRLCAHGRRMRDRRTPDGMQRAVEYYERALEIDPAYAEAWVGLGTALALLLDYRHVDPDRERPRAENAIRRALELDPHLPEAFGALGAFCSAVGDRPAEEQALKRAVELQPGYSEAHNWLSWHYLVVGRGDEALASALRAVQFDPLLPEAVSNLALSLLATGNAERALLEARRLRELQPDWTTARFYEALALYHLGNFDDVIALLEGLSVEWAGTGPQLTLALAYVKTGAVEKAAAMLESFTAAQDGYSAAVTQLALGEIDDAFDRLRRADLSTYWPALSLHFFYPDVLAPLRRAPFFRQMVEQLSA